ncbi:MAG: hypothetical protein NVV83_19310 [Afipia sp.]|uniref:Uncharacterized protein n=1 Tax=Afipia massiliensis TaxID=211460 RepID=A0A840MYM8_9BRAD|nr:hypothetical protein [Afipia massiliensis]MCR6736095.1 hypothetical protein [Afipia sp.]
MRQDRYRWRQHLLSLAVYAAIWGRRFAARFNRLLLAHEMGHYVAAR